MEPDFNALVATLARLESIEVLISTWVLIYAFNRLAPASVTAGPLFARLQPLQPVLVSSLLIWLPGMVPTGTPAGPRVLLGIVLGAFSGWGHKLLRQTGFGDDERIPDQAEPPKPSPPLGGGL